MFGNDRTGTEVVSMTDLEKQKRLAPLRLLETYWRSLADETGEIPLRSQIDPRGIESALEYAFLAERITPSLAKLRVSGTHLNDLMGMETSGMPLSTLFTPEARDALGDAVARVFSEGAIVRMRLDAEEGLGKGALDAHMTLLPLRSDMGDLTRMIGALATTGRIGRTPRRFSIAETEFLPAFGAGRPAAPNYRQDERPTPELSEPPAAFHGEPPRTAPDSPSRKHPHLRLIVDND